MLNRSLLDQYGPPLAAALALIVGLALHAGAQHAFRTLPALTTAHAAVAALGHAARGEIIVTYVPSVPAASTNIGAQGSTNASAPQPQAAPSVTGAQAVGIGIIACPAYLAATGDDPAVGHGLAFLDWAQGYASGLNEALSADGEGLRVLPSGDKEALLADHLAWRAWCSGHPAARLMDAVGAWFRSLPQAR